METKLYDVMGYIDIMDKQHRIKKIQEMEDKYRSMEQQFSQKPPKKV